MTEETSITEESVQLMKHHGSYMQDDRDKRSLGQGKFYQFMMRTRQPGGHVSNQLYLTMDDLADQVSAPNANSCLHMLICRGPQPLVEIKQRPTAPDALGAELCCTALPPSTPP